MANIMRSKSRVEFRAFPCSMADILREEIGGLEAHTGMRLAKSGFYVVEWSVRLTALESLGKGSVKC